MRETRRRDYIPKIVREVAQQATGAGSGRYIINFYKQHGSVPPEYAEEFYTRIQLRERELNFEATPA